MGILDAMGSIDWIGPAISLVSQVSGAGYRFQIPVCEMTGREIEWMLRAEGIKTWGLVMDMEDTIMLNVPKSDAGKAYGILQAAGVPVENPPQSRQSGPKRKPQSGGVWSVFDVFDR